MVSISLANFLELQCSYVKLARMKSQSMTLFNNQAITTSTVL